DGTGKGSTQKYKLDLSVRMYNYLSDIVLFSNLSSPEYIIALRKMKKERGKKRGKKENDKLSLINLKHMNIWVCVCFSSAVICSVSPSSCPWHPVSPSLCTSSDGSHPKRNIHQELQKWQRAGTPSLLRETRSRREFSFNYDINLYLVNLYQTHISPVDAPKASALAM
uniref:Uncharacterized protein n=1 Tax=Cyprinus carpio TaxID=7962 RepID=A0A8C1V3N3_CYPCA